MNLEQALEIVQDHIRIGKGMGLTNGVPEALEMVVEELVVTRKALELAHAKLLRETIKYHFATPADIDSLAELEQLRHYVNCPHHRKCILPEYCDSECQNCYAIIAFKEG